MSSLQMIGLELRNDVLLLHHIRDNCWRAENVTSQTTCRGEV